LNFLLHHWHVTLSSKSSDGSFEGLKLEAPASPPEAGPFAYIACLNIRDSFFHFGIFFPGWFDAAGFF